MKPALSARCCACLALGLAVVCGCGGGPKPPKTTEEQAPSSAVGQMTMGGSVIRVADPEGRWRFEARSAHIEADGVDGPYRLQPAECKYEEQGRAPVLMIAERARLDKQAQRVELEGKVRVTHQLWVMEAGKVVYDLKAGKVAATGQPKLSYDADNIPGEQGSSP